MTDYDSIWHLQDEMRTIVNAVLGETIWNLSYNEQRRAIELELSLHLEEESASNLCSQFPTTVDYDGEGTHGSKFVAFL
ncbi:MAG: hypothetical protein K6C10_02780 [Prevotella sp.]|nr:hypothetical protein [Prevotella sp.]